MQPNQNPQYNNPQYPGMQPTQNQYQNYQYAMQMQMMRQRQMSQNAPNQQAPRPQTKNKKLPFHLIGCPVSLKPQDTDIHVANFNNEIAIINFQIFCTKDVIFSLFLSVRETEHQNKKCTQQLKTVGENVYEKHFKISASEQDPKEDFNVYIEAPIDLDKLSELTPYEEGSVLGSQRYQVIVRLVKLYYANFIRIIIFLYQNIADNDRIHFLK